MLIFLVFSTIPFTSLFGRNKIQFGRNENQFGTNEIQFGRNEIQFGTNENQCRTNEIQFGTNENQFGRNEIQIDINETIFCFLLAIFIFWHNFKKRSFLNSYNIHVYSFIIVVTNNINMYIYSDTIIDPIFRPKITET